MVVHAVNVFFHRINLRIMSVNAFFQRVEVGLLFVDAFFKRVEMFFNTFCKRGLVVGADVEAVPNPLVFGHAFGTLFGNGGLPALNALLLVADHLGNLGRRPDRTLIGLGLIVKRDAVQRLCAEGIVGGFGVVGGLCECGGGHLGQRRVGQQLVTVVNHKVERLGKVHLLEVAESGRPVAERDLQLPHGVGGKRVRLAIDGVARFAVHKPAVELQRRVVLYKAVVVPGHGRENDGVGVGGYRHGGAHRAETNGGSEQECAELEDSCLFHDK